MNALAAVSKGMQAVKLCTNKIRQFLNGGASYHRLNCIMAVKRLLLLLSFRYVLPNPSVKKENPT